MTRALREVANNLHITVRCPSSTSPALPVRMEQKFFIRPDRMPAAHALLLRTCRLDPEYPFGQISSVYFDTLDLDQHERSMEGELVKDKVRIRWYGEEHDPHHARRQADGDASVDVWLELKSRRGFDSTKQRRQIRVPRARLALPALARGIVPPTVLRHTTASFGFFPPAPIRPVIVISYFRRRFVEPATGRRLSIDSRIRSTMLVPGVGVGERGLALPGGLVEVKCSDIDLPPSLLELAELGSSWGRFSKYSACLEAHMAERGSVSRLWPSGLLEEEPGALSGVPKERGRGRQDEAGVGPGSTGSETVDAPGSGDAVA